VWRRSDRAWTDEELRRIGGADELPIATARRDDELRALSRRPAPRPGELRDELQRERPRGVHRGQQRHGVHPLSLTAYRLSTRGRSRLGPREPRHLSSSRGSQTGLSGASRTPCVPLGWPGGTVGRRWESLRRCRSASIDIYRGITRDESASVEGRQTAWSSGIRLRQRRGRDSNPRGTREGP
jgi:hypothetical protein